MTGKIDNRENLLNLIDALVDDIENMSVDDLRSEMNEDEIEAGDIANLYQTMYAQTAKDIGRKRIAEARRRLEIVKREKTVARPRSGDDQRRAFLSRLSRDNADMNMTLAARSASGGIDPDLDSALDDWEELGDLENDRNDEQ